MRSWILALTVGIVTIFLIQLANSSGLRSEGIMVGALALVFLVWAAAWAFGRHVRRA